jgi:hypothetical protein
MVLIELLIKRPVNKKESITVSYSAISCACAQWLLEGPGEEHIYLSRADTNLPIADMLWDGLTLPLRLQLKGRFYKETGYPPGYMPVKGDPKPARVFQYSELKVVKAK